jgi:hypothetical protein
VLLTYKLSYNYLNHTRFYIIDKNINNIIPLYKIYVYIFFYSEFIILVEFKKLKIVSQLTSPNTSSILLRWLIIIINGSGAWGVLLSVLFYINVKLADLLG